MMPPNFDSVCASNRWGGALRLRTPGAGVGFRGWDPVGPASLQVGEAPT